MDFTRFPDGSKVKMRASQYCVEYVVISERDKEENVVVCDGDPRVDQIYRSRGHVVDIRLSEQLTGRSSPVHFLIKYEGLFRSRVIDYDGASLLGGRLRNSANVTRLERWPD